MAEEKNIEYRLVWPNHQVYAEQILPENISLIQDTINDKLEQLGVPSQYWPIREARVMRVVVEEGTWEAPATAEKKVPGKAKGKDK